MPTELASPLDRECRRSQKGSLEAPSNRWDQNFDTVSSAGESATLEDLRLNPGSQVSGPRAGGEEWVRSAGRRCRLGESLINNRAGEVAVIGEGVTRVRIGDRIAGCFHPRWVWRTDRTGARQESRDRSLTA
jgi:hypothetical protein